MSMEGAPRAKEIGAKELMPATLAEGGAVGSVEADAHARGVGEAAAGPHSDAAHRRAARALDRRRRRLRAPRAAVRDGDRHRLAAEPEPERVAAARRPAHDRPDEAHAGDDLRPL